MKYGRRPFAALLAFYLVCMTGAQLSAQTYGAMIIPPRKPAQTVSVPAKDVYFKPGIKDILKAAPVPTRKPETAAKAATGPAPSNYRKIFELQQAGKMKEADPLIAQLGEASLMGYIQQQRYLHPSYKSNFDELKTWMDSYADYAGADRIYKLAQRKKPANYSGELAEPVEMTSTPRQDETIAQPGQKYESALKRSDTAKTKIKNFEKRVIDLVRDKNHQLALGLLQSDQTVLILDTAEYDRLLAEIAAAFYYGGDITRAYDLASKAADRSSTYAPLSGWIAGLSAWRQEKYAKAATYFKIPASSKYSSGWLASAGAYWTARAYERAGSLGRYTGWYERARRYERTFYGLAATKALGLPHPFNWQTDTNTPQPYKTLIAATPVGKRALELHAAGQRDMAEQELLRLQPQRQRDHEALSAFADEAGMKTLSRKLGKYSSKPGNVKNDSTLYPIAHWLNDEEYEVDPALIHAIVLQESKFNPKAQSPDGARGLMQIMPSTASLVVKDPTLQTAEGSQRLLDPKTNIQIGQRYLKNLLENRAVGGDVAKLLVAYNAGPGNLAKWNEHMKDITDPLLYIESIPSGQTREYVERVISSYWIYKLRSGRDIPSFASLVAGENVIYAGKKI